jgi:choline dehydrogenase
VIAARLSEDPDVQVVLLEAGPPVGPDAMADPSAWPALLGTEVDWAFDSTPQAGLDGHTVPYPRGKVLGGSSSINALAHIRGHRSTYDKWVAEGATGWGYDNLLPYFRRSETSEAGDPKYRGAAGPMRVSVPRERHPFALMAREAVQECGYPLSGDFSGSEQEGAGFVELNVVEGRRQSAADAYLRPVLDLRSNLTVITGALVHRLLMSEGRCTGVEYTLEDGLRRKALASSETVLCAGVFGSPQILMLSGIGPADELSEQGISMAVELPHVGRNLQDHPVCPMVFASTQTIPMVANAATLFALLRSDAHLEAPDIQLIFVEFPYSPITGIEASGGFSIVPTVLAPRSRGTVRLASADPRAAPVIDPAFFSDSADIETMLAGLRLAREIAGAKAFAPLRPEEFLPGNKAGTPDGQIASLRKGTSSAAHPVGTCRIGTDAASAVVDPELRVHGVAGLRVADASVMPSLIGANTNATVLAIAERAAELIRG